MQFFRIWRWQCKTRSLQPWTMPSACRKSAERKHRYNRRVKNTYFRWLQWTAVYANKRLGCFFPCHLIVAYFLLVCILLFLYCIFPELIRFKVEPEVNSFAHIVTQNKDNTIHNQLYFLHSNGLIIHTWDHLDGFSARRKDDDDDNGTIDNGRWYRETKEKKKKKKQQQQHHTLTLLTVWNNNNKPS